ncbi:DMT family transporter [Gammaproteobacteria bacterium]|nr:DMT family transporter [Gammaproteobacteria bacterium]
MSKPNIQLGILYSFMSLVLLGLMPVISNSRPGQLNALNFALYLSIWQLICSLPLVFTELRLGNPGIFAAELSEKAKTRAIAIIMVTGLIFGISTYVYVLSVEKAGTVSAAIAIQAYPLFAILWETIFLDRRKSRGELFFTGLLITSLYYLGTGGTWKIGGISFWFLVALGVPFLWSVAHVIIKEVLDKTPITPGQVTFFRVLVSSVALFFIALIINGTDSVLAGFSNMEFQLFALLMGFVYYLELVVWFYAVKHIDVSVASSITTPWPVVTMILATIFLQETIVGYQIFTMIFVAISIYGLLYAGKKKRAALA